MLCTVDWDDDEPGSGEAGGGLSGDAFGGLYISNGSRYLITTVLGWPIAVVAPTLSIASCALILSTATFTLRGVAPMCRSRSQQGRRRVDKLVGVVQTFDVNLEAQGRRLRTGQNDREHWERRGKCRRR